MTGPNSVEDYDWSKVAGRKPDAMIFYGPPRDWRGRLRNRVRKAFGLAEQNVIYRVFSGVSAKGDRDVTVSWDASGHLRIEDE